MKNKYDYIIGIDTGVITGIAIWNVSEKKFLEITSLVIHKALDIALDFNINYSTLIRIEDARLRKWIPKHEGREKLQGVGSVKRDAKIWEDFCKDYDIDYNLVAPKNNRTKLKKEAFKKITGWEGITNEHGRDAGMLVFNYR